jgi:hypothetical protein
MMPGYKPNRIPPAKGFRRPGPEPTHEELEKLWAQWKASQAAAQ